MTPRTIAAMALVGSGIKRAFERLQRCVFTRFRKVILSDFGHRPGKAEQAVRCATRLTEL
jgi:hypothetical protein